MKNSLDQLGMISKCVGFPKVTSTFGDSLEFMGFSIWSYSQPRLITAKEYKAISEGKRGMWQSPGKWEETAKHALSE